MAIVAKNDITHFIDLAARIPIKPEFIDDSLEEANFALVALKERTVRGAKVLVIENTC